MRRGCSKRARRDASFEFELIVSDTDDFHSPRVMILTAETHHGV